MTTITIERDKIENAIGRLVASLPYIGAGYKTAHTRETTLECINDLRAALAAPATAPKSKPSIISAGAWPFGDDKKGRCSHCQRLVDVLAAPATAPEQPAWHDAPTCAGVWLSKTKDSDVPAVGAWNLPPELIDRPYWSEMLWYGPIPQDAKAEWRTE